MNKKSILNGLFLLGLVHVASVANAQKPVTVSPKTSTSRTDTNSTTSVTVPGDNQPAQPTTTQPSTTVPVVGTNNNGTNNNATNDPNSTGVQGTSTSPTSLPNQPSVNTQGTSGTNGGKGGGKKGGKVVKAGGSTTSTDATTKAGSDEKTVPVTAATGNQASDKAPVIMMQDDGRKPVSEANLAPAGAVELKDLKRDPSTDWTQQPWKTGETPTAPSGAGGGATGATEEKVAVPAVSGTQSVYKNEVAGVKRACEDEALKEIYRIMNSDHNAFAKMVELTTMRLAKKALEEGNATLEGYTQTKITELEGYFAKSKEAGAVQDKIKAAYELYGKGKDAAEINASLEAALARGKKACYWSSSTHLENDHAAAFVLAMSAANPDSGVTDADAATIWAVDKIRAQGAKSGAGATKGGNALNITNRVARYIASVQSASDVEAAIAAQEKELNALLADARGRAEGVLEKCMADVEKESGQKHCDNCQAKAKASLAAASSLEQMQKGLALAVQKSENTVMVDKFKGKTGEIDFDLSNFSQNAVHKDPARMKGFDACGTPKVVVGSGAPSKGGSGGGKVAQDQSCTGPDCQKGERPLFMSRDNGSKTNTTTTTASTGGANESSVMGYNNSYPFSYSPSWNTAVADKTYVDNSRAQIKAQQAYQYFQKPAYQEKKQTRKPAAVYERFEDRDPVLRSVDEFFNPGMSMVRKIQKFMADPRTKAMAQKMYKKNPAAYNSIISHLKSADSYYIVNPYGLRYDLYLVGFNAFDI